MSEQPHVHMCEVGRFVYVLLPSENRRFREAMADVGYLVRLETRRRPVYRLTADQAPAFGELVARHYPAWGVYRWGWRTWDDIPPWVREAIAELSAQAFERMGSMRVITREDESR